MTTGNCYQLVTYKKGTIQLWLRNGEFNFHFIGIILKCLFIQLSFIPIIGQGFQIFRI